MTSAKFVAIGVGGDLDPGVVDVYTLQGSHYRFPDMDKTELRRILPAGESRLSESIPSLAMCNASYVVLTIPFRIIDKIYVDKELWWSNPVSPV